MIVHHLQKTILRKLGGYEKARYSDIKPETIEGNIFTYHLQQLIKQGYALKGEDGLYALTSKGKNFLVTNGRPSHENSTESHSVLLLAVRREREWLVRRRLIQPNLNMVGFVHGEPQSNEGVTVTAEKRLQQKTGLRAHFIVRATGLIRIYKSDMLESFSHCILLYAENPTGNLLVTDETGENSWVKQESFKDNDFLPSMHDLMEILLVGQEITFFDKTYQL